MGIATIVPALIALIGGRGAPPEQLSPSRAWRCSPEPRLVHLVAQLTICFSTLMLALAALLLISAALVAASSRPRADVGVTYGG